MKRYLFTLLTMAAMLTFLGDDCSGSLVEDPSFHLWENDGKLAAWDVTEGHIRKAPTWDDRDPGVEFVDTPTEIAQKLTASAECARVKVMGKVSNDAALRIRTSSGPGFVVPQLDWASYTSYVSLAAPAPPDGGAPSDGGATLFIGKNGPGTVVLATIEVQRVAGCGPSVYAP